MKKQYGQLSRVFGANYFTKLLLFVLFLPPSVSEAQKLSTAPSYLVSQEGRIDPIAYFKELNKDPLSLLKLKNEPTEADAPVVCYTITNPSAAQTLCVDATGNNITVNTNMNLGGGIRFVRFTTDQMAGPTPTIAESNFIYSYTPGTYKDIAYVTPTGASNPYTATYTFYSPDFPNTTNAPITYYVYAVFNQGVVNSTCNPNPAVEIQVTVKPKPKVNAVADQYVCAGSATSAVTLTGSGVSGTTYAWTNTTTSIGLSASGVTTIPSFTAVNATSSPVTATITATPTASSCVGDPLTSKIIVYPASATMISGVAFKDFNENGVREGAEGVQAGIIASVYNSAGTLVGKDTTDANGFWSLSGLTFGGANDKYRVEFLIPTALSTTGLQPSAKGTANGTDVQFVSAASCNINFGVNYPATYCQSNPVLATPCYTNGSRASNPNDAAVVLFNYNDRGQGLSHEMVASVSEVGAVWGETYNPKNKKLYVSAFVKRHVDLAPNGLGAIYEIDVTTPTTAGAGTPTLWLDINAATFVNTSNVAVNLGLPADPGIATRGLGLKTDPSRDNWAFDYVGKQGIGDIELSQDGQRLYVMDLTNRQVLCIDYTTKKLIWKLAVSTPTCAGGSTDIRPWALKEHNGVLYVGAICSGETNNNAAQLHFYVMQCNSLTAATSMSLAADLGSSITKQDGVPWQYWAATATEAGIAATGNNGYMNAAQPILSDIGFDKDENMIIGFMDRFGHQVGYANYLPNTTNTNLVHGIAHGDITRALKNGSTYTVETAPWSFFYLTANIPSPPFDQFIGGMFVSSLSGTNYVTANMIDPFDYVSAGTTWVKTSDGQRQGGTNATSRLEIVPNSTTSAYFGKANGLGDLSVFCSTAPIQIGNYIWYDLNKNGVQDPNETPLSNVTVELWKNNAKIASAITNASGEYYFSDKNASNVTWIGTGADTTLRESMAYELKVYAKQTKLDTTVLTTQNSVVNSGNDQNDSDAFIRGDSAIISLTTGVYGSVNHTYDFGFYGKPCSITLTPSVSGCYQSGGVSKATVSVEVAWSNPPGTAPTYDPITVTVGSQTKTITPGQISVNYGYQVGSQNQTIVSPQVLAFELNADGSSQTIEAYFGSSFAASTCKQSQTVTLPAACPTLACSGNNTGGQVFNDFNANGIKESGESLGLQNVTVKAFDCQGNLLETTATDASGKYVFSTLIATNYPIRIEFSGLPATYGQGTSKGTNGRTTTQFVNAATCNIDLGVLDATDYCQANPKLIIPCYVYGDPLPVGSASGTRDALVSFDYTLSGLQNMAAMQHPAVASQVGSLWGVAYNKFTKKAFSSATLKRHAGLGPLGLGGIYVSDYTNPASPTTAQLGSVSAWGIDVGTIPSNSARGLQTDPAQPSADSLAYLAIGKVGIGGIDLSSDGDTLFLTNLNDNKLYAVDITAYNTSGTIPTMANVTSYDVGSGVNCVGGNLRIWGVKQYKGKVYTTMICDAGLSQNKSDLRAYVRELDLTTSAVTTVFDFPLTYPKGFPEVGLPTITGWFPWTDNWDTKRNVDVLVHPEPIFTGIEFDVDGSMVLSFSDRTAYQTGVDNYRPNGTGIFRGIIGGDLLRAYKSGNTFILENNATAGPVVGGRANNSQGPGYGEFYSDDFTVNNDLTVIHTETVMGGLALKPGSGEVIAAVIDPVNNPTWADWNNYANTGGVRHMNNSTGQVNSAYQVYRTSDGTGNGVGTFAKAVGLGDIALVCDAPTYLEIGNYVWSDTDGDGVQDPCEPPLSNVTVTLWKGGTQIASTTTNSSGEYYFSDKNASGVTWTGTGADTTLLPLMAYEVRIDTSNQAAFIKLALTAANSTANNGNDQNDNDAVTTGKYKVISFTTGAAGSVNHTYDFGFYPFCDTTLVVTNAATCSGTAVDLFALASGVKGTLTYSTNGITWTALTSPTNVTPSVTTTYYIKDTLVSGCFDIDTLVITVNPLPTPPSVSSPIMNICPLTTVDLTTISSALTPSVSGGVFEWHVSNSSSSAIVSNQMTVVAGDYYLFERSPAGCYSTGLKVTVAIQVCCPSPLCLPVTVTRNN